MLRELDEELYALNAKVDEAIDIRTKWMDEHMKDYAEYSIGEALFSLKTGVKVGVVSDYYRYHQGDPRFDTNMCIHYRYQTSDNCYDNTSRQSPGSVGNKQELISHKELELMLAKNIKVQDDE